MTKSEIIANHIRKWEGGYANIPDDKGGPTKWGITIGTYRYYFGKEKTVQDLKNMTEKEWVYIFKYVFYNPAKIAEVNNLSLSTLIMDICWMSGRITAIKKIQRAIGTTPDGIVGPKTLKILNDFPEWSFNQIYQMRYAWFKAIVEKNPTQKKFLKGWINRLNSIKYEESN